MKKLTFIIFILPLLVTGCINEYGSPSSLATRVDMSELLRDPLPWNGKVVQVQGAFNWELEGDAIFQTKEDLKQRNRKNAIALVLDDPALKIPYGKDDKNNIWRKIFVPLSLRHHIGKTASVVGVFRTRSPDGFYRCDIAVTQLVLK